eukprot:2219093-Pleurochrysis_carterae.AAC.2
MEVRTEKSFILLDFRAFLGYRSLAIEACERCWGWRVGMDGGADLAHGRNNRDGCCCVSNSRLISSDLAQIPSTHLAGTSCFRDLRYGAARAALQYESKSTHMNTALQKSVHACKLSALA